MLILMVNWNSHFDGHSDDYPDHSSFDDPQDVRLTHSPQTFGGEKASHKKHSPTELHGPIGNIN